LIFSFSKHVFALPGRTRSDDFSARTGAKERESEQLQTLFATVSTACGV
jgi:hypothetical protein